MEVLTVTMLNPEWLHPTGLGIHFGGSAVWTLGLVGVSAGEQNC